LKEIILKKVRFCGIL